MTGALLGLTDTISINGKPPTIVDFDAASGTILTTSPAGREVERTIDALGRTVSIAIGSPPGSGGFHPIQPTHGFTFTKVDQEALYTPPSVAGTGPTTTPHDLDRRLDDILRPDGTTLDFEYDAAGRLEQVFVNSVLQTTYAYHPNGARTSKTQGAVTSGSYDNQDRIATWGASSFTTPRTASG